MSQAAIENLLKETMGLDTPSIGSAALERAIQRRMTECRSVGIDDYWHQLTTSREEVQELIEAVVVPETSFFRHAESFGALNRLITNDWVPAHPYGSLRILSVPCSTGEEPYSIVMSLLMAGLPALQFAVDAVDISNNALTLARRGVYGKNSFRGGDLGYRDRFFTRMDAGYEISPAVKEKVQFQRVNVLHMDTQLNRGRYDIIFCRNLLIYFDRETQERILNILKLMLTPQGTMFVGPAEALLMRLVGFAPTGDSMAFAFREEKTPRPRALPAHEFPPAFKAPPPLPSLLKPPIVLPPPPTLAPVKTQPAATFSMPHRESPDLEKARAMADAGNLDEAIRICQAHQKQHGDTAEAYYLLGLVYDARGDETQAAEGYRKAVYLDPNHREALIHLALLAERRGDMAGARRLHERAKRVA